MSAQKLTAEAEKLLEKGKVPEAIEKLKQAMQLEPLNQLISTRLATVFVDIGQPENASKVFVILANKLTEGGKPQVAIAVLKQALEITPNDINLRIRYAQNSEECGKLGDAGAQAQIAFQHFLKRKKHFDAVNLLPLMVRVQPKDEKLKFAWLELLQLSQGEQKLIHALVAIAGPPGLTSQEFTTGGDPLQISEPLYQGLKNLVNHFPRDPKVAYAVAWASYRRGRKKEFYEYLRESLRRDPDFTLSLLLFCRSLAENQKLNECMFVYKHLKERMPADKSVDMLTLNRLLEGFVEKNGWINFSDGMDALDAATFVGCFGLKAQDPEAMAGDEAVSETLGTKPSMDGDEEDSLPPAEIELSLDSGSGAGSEMEIQFTSNAATVPSRQKDPSPSSSPSVPQSSASAKPESIPAGPSEETLEQLRAAKEAAALAEKRAQEEIARAKEEAARAEREAQEEIARAKELARKAEIERQEALAKAAAELKAAQEAKQKELEQLREEQVKAEKAKLEEAARQADLQAKEAEENARAASAINSSDGIEDSGPEASTGSVEFTSIIKLEQPHSLKDETLENVSRKDSESLSLPPIASAEVNAEQEKRGFNPLEHLESEQPSLPPLSEIDHDKTQVFSPIDILGAANILQGDSSRVATRKILESAEELRGEVKPLTPSLPETEESTLPGVANEIKALKIEGEPTKIISPVEALQDAKKSHRPFEKKIELPASAPPPLPEALASENGDGATQIVSLQEGERPRMPTPQSPPLPTDPSSSVAVPLGFEPLSEAALAPTETKQGADETIDLGDDLLEGPTKIIVSKEVRDSTRQYEREIRKQSKGRARAPDVEDLVNKSERYLAKRNFYLARKALRQAATLGADETMIKNKMSEIRKLELPDSLYFTQSLDESRTTNTESILDSLEAEFFADDPPNLVDDEALHAQIREVVESGDSRTSIDFAIALYEMGLYRQTEMLLSELVERDPDCGFDALYLAALAKRARKDLAGAASVLKELAKDVTKSEQEKIQVYYALGEVLEKMKRGNMAQEYFLKVSELDSNYLAVRQKLKL